MLLDAQAIRETGDAEYLLGVCLYCLGRGIEAYGRFKRALGMGWIEPGVGHRRAAMLEAVGYMQRILYGRTGEGGEVLGVLVELSYEKLRIIKEFDAEGSVTRGDLYYSALAMADLSEIYYKFGEYQQAYEKIGTAIQMIQG